jgi:hypothetical protein
VSEARERLAEAVEALQRGIESATARLQAGIDEADWPGRRRTVFDMCDTAGQPILAPLYAALVTGLVALGVDP